MIIYAVNIHTGGGRILLDTLLSKNPFEPTSAAFIDARYVPPTGSPIEFFRIPARIWSRFKSEFLLAEFSAKNPQEEILFFGNLPPFFKKTGRSVLYLQNCFLTRQVPLPKDSLKTFIRTWLESKIIYFFHRNVDEIWVQTEWMKMASARYLPKAKISVKPILPLLPAPNSAIQKKFDFIYVGSFMFHKRLDFFFEALKLLDNEKTDLKVAIVLDNLEQIDFLREKNLFIHIEIQYFNNVSRETLAELYQMSYNFVATSLYESFLLPIYEADFYGCHLILPQAGYTEHLPMKFTVYPTNSVSELTNKLRTCLK